MKDISAIIARADSMRDRRLPGEAARLYREALSLDPARFDLWVQLGNMLKDSASFDEADVAYERALALVPNDADCWLQRGRSQRLGGRRGEALRSFANVLQCVPGHSDAVSELAQLGAAWEAGQQQELGPRLLIDLFDTTAQMRQLISRIETELPVISQINRFPVSQYDSVRRLRQTPSPGGVDHQYVLSVVMRGDAPLDSVLRILRSFQQQTHTAFRFVMPDLTGESRLAFERLSFSRAENFLRRFGGDTLAILMSMPISDGCVLISRPAIIQPTALSWVSYYLNSCQFTGVLFNEDHVEFHGEQRKFSQPLLRGQIDREMLEQGIDHGIAISGKSEAIQRALVDKQLPMVDDRDLSIARITSMILRTGDISIIPHPLVSRIDRGSLSGIDGSSCNYQTTEFAGKISVIIPTKDRVELLKKAVGAIQNTARDLSRIEVVVIDNGSVESETARYLHSKCESNEIRTVRVDEPFNWSRLNRFGVEYTRNADYFVFMNNDVFVCSAGWDDRIVGLLSRREVGVVGAQLHYPNGTIQHAGIVMTPDGLTEHDGRGEPASAVGPSGRFQIRRSVTAVTGALLGTRRETFYELGGFDEENLPIWFNDVDYCLRSWSAGLRVLYEPAIKAIHQESVSIGRLFSSDSSRQYFTDASSFMKTKWGSEFTEEAWSPIYV